ncbi:MAG: hypothetical protein Q4D26_12625 [Clostridia bacterium]|nr:hypothetical protein [Clostridia bacterium]
MSLRLFSDICYVPKDMKVVFDNEDYFMRYTVPKLDERINGILKHTDGAEYIDKMSFKDKFGYRVPWVGLSTGGKTILNIYCNPDVCFDTLECSLNALADLKNLRQGCAMPDVLRDFDGDDSIDVIIDDNEDYRYTSLEEMRA